MKLIGIDQRTGQLILPVGSPYHLRLRILDADGHLASLEGRDYALTLFRDGMTLHSVPGTLSADDDGDLVTFSLAGSATADVTSGRWEISQVYSDGKTPLLLGALKMLPTAPTAAGDGDYEPSGAFDNVLWSPSIQTLFAEMQGPPGVPGSAAAETIVVAANIANVQTVAGSIANVGSVAGSITNVNAVAGSLANVNAVGAAISDVSTVAANLAAVGVVATNIAAVDSVATNIALVVAVGTNGANIATVAGISGAVTTVAGAATNVGLVGASIANVNTVAGIAGNITSVAGISGAVTTVAGAVSNVGVVAGSITNVNLVATDLALGGSSLIAQALPAAVQAGANAALTAADRVQTGVDRLQVANDRAATAVDLAAAQVAALAAGAFPNSAATTVPGGIASGSRYSALSADGWYLQRYLNNAGTPLADSGVTVPTAMVFQLLGHDAPSGLAGVLAADKLGRISMQVEADGSVTSAQQYILTLTGDTVTIGKDFNLGALSVRALAPQGWSRVDYDKVGRMAGGLTDVGLLYYKSAQFSDVTAYAVNIGTGQIEPRAPSEYAHVFFDKYGRIAAALGSDGTYYFSDVNIKGSLNGIPISTVLAGGSGGGTKTPIYLDADYNLIGLEGQSVMAGAFGSPLVSVSGETQGLMWNGGARPYDAGGSIAAQHASLVNLVENDRGAAGAETPSTGFVSYFEQVATVKYGLVPASIPYRFICEVNAISGYSAAQLAVGTTAHNSRRQGIASLASLATAAGKMARYHGFALDQGQADYSLGTAASVWAASWEAVRSDLETYARAQGVLPSTVNAICIMSQIEGHVSAGVDPYLAIKMRDIALTDPKYFISHPDYFFPNNGLPHKTALGYKWKGAYYQRVFQRVVLERGTWHNGLRFISGYRVGDTIWLELNPEAGLTTRGQLVFDTTTKALVPKFGFQVVTSGGSPVTINTPEIVNGRFIKIVAPGCGAGATVRYGYQDGGGNLRDDIGNEIIATLNGLNLPLHNWMLVDNLTVN